VAGAEHLGVAADASGAEALRYNNVGSVRVAGVALVRGLARGSRHTFRVVC
jgi:hypothetical protein